MSTYAARYAEGRGNIPNRYLLVEEFTASSGDLKIHDVIQIPKKSGDAVVDQERWEAIENEIEAWEAKNEVALA